MNEKSSSEQHMAVRRAFYALLSVAAIISIIRGVQNALTNSQDMQWSPMIVFWRDGLDPYQLLIQDPNTPKFILSQAPNHLHYFFFLLAPLALFNFETAKIVWAAANIVFLGAILWILHRDKNIRMPLTLALIFLCAMPTRTALGNGQLSLFCLFFFVLYLQFAGRRPLLAALFASIGAGKYNLGAPLFFQMRLTPLNIAAFGAIPVITVIYWCIHFKLGFFEALFLPIRVTTFTLGPHDGVGDFLMLIRGAGLPPLAAYGVAAALLVIIVLLQKNFLPTDDRLLSFAFYAVLSLWFVYHGSHDFVFLLPVILAAIRSKNGTVRSGLIAGTIYFWFVMKFLLDAFAFASPEFNLALLVLMQGLIAWEIRLRGAAAKSAIVGQALEA